jgi:hypothetical protein
VRAQIETSFFFSVLDLSGSRSTSGAVLLPSSSAATYRRRKEHGLARVTTRSVVNGSQGSGGVARWRRREVKCGRRRERERERGAVTLDL